MSKPSQTVFPGKLQRNFERALQSLIRERVVERLSEHDLSLWHGAELDKDSGHRRYDLHWLDLPVSLGPHLEQVAQSAQAALDEGFHQWVLVALGDAGFTAQTLLPLINLRPGLQFFALDSVDPSAICRIESQLDLRHTFFVLASKTGDKLEDQALHLHFRERLIHSEISQPLRHFGCLTESGSYLAGMSRGYAFRFSLYDPPGLLTSSRSVLHYGALLTGLAGLSPNDVLRPVRELRLSCLSSNAGNQALHLAAFLQANAEAGHHFVVFLASSALQLYTVRLRQLVGSGLARNEAGPIPIAGRLSLYTEPFEDCSAFVILEQAGQQDAELTQKCEQFAASGVPFLRAQISGPTDLLAESYKWELGTIAAAAQLGIDPFVWPEVRASRRLAMEMLDGLSPAKDTLARVPRLQEHGIALYAETATRQEISTLNLVESLRSFFAIRPTGGFPSLLVFLERTEALEAFLYRIREALTVALRQPVALAYDLPSKDLYNDLFQRDFHQGLCLMITAEPSVDMPVPGAHYSFSQLHRALALGEFESLAAAGRFVLRLHLSSSAPEALSALERLLVQALRGS